MNKYTYRLLAGVFALATTSLQADSLPAELAAFAGEADSCIAILDRESNKTLVHNPEQCKQRLSPCSTFKIPNALIGLPLIKLTEFLENEGFSILGDGSPGSANERK